MSIVKWLKVIVKLRLNLKEKLTVDSPLLVRVKGGKVVPMTGAYMASMDKIYSPVLGWHKATIHSRRRGFATAAVRNGIHMAYITIAMRHSQGEPCNMWLSVWLRKRQLLQDWPSQLIGKNLGLVVQPRNADDGPDYNC